MKRIRGREPRISKAGNHINLTFDSPGTSMTDLDDSDVDPCYNREDLDARFKAIAIDLTSAKEALDASECESAAFRSSIDDLMKVVHSSLTLASSDTRSLISSPSEERLVGTSSPRWTLVGAASLRTGAFATFRLRRRGGGGAARG